MTHHERNENNEYQGEEIAVPQQRRCEEEGYAKFELHL
jgi:hypothetical protein